MTFDPTFTFGNLLSLVIVLISLLAAVWKIGTKLDLLQLKMDLIWRWYKREHKIDEDERE